MGMGSQNRYIKHFTCKYAGGSGASGDYCGTGTENTRIRTLGTAQTEFHNRITLGCVAYTCCFGCNQTLVIDNV